MDIALVAVGRLKAGPERELCARYLDRASKSGARLGFRGFQVKEIPESRAPQALERLRQEETALLSAFETAGQCICLDASGEQADTGTLATRLAHAAEAGTSAIVFVVGGPDGLSEHVLQRADWRLAFGRLTWPHQLARVMLAEQLYRAMTILSGHPYHRA